MNRVSSYLLNILVIGVFAASGSGESTQSQGSDRNNGNLTGAWRLNNDLSDDVTKVMETTYGERHGGHKPPSGVAGHGPGMHGGGRDTRSGGMDAVQQMRMWLHEPAARLTITQTDSSVMFIEGDGRSQTLVTNNERQRLPLGTGTVDVRTKWDDGRLVKESSLADGARVTETYSVVPESRQLHVLVKLTGSRLPRPVSFRRVYEAESVR